MNKKNVLYIIEDDKSAQFRYRVKNVSEVLKNNNSNWRVDWIKKDIISEINYDKLSFIVVLRQTDKNGKISDLIDTAHKKGIKVLFDLDDLIFDYRDLRLLMKSTNSKNVVYWLGYFWGIRRIAKKADGFICTNEFLAKKLKRSFGKTVKIIPNSLNQEQVDESARLIKEKDALENTEKKFLIGYFSGSPTHYRDFHLIENDLISFLENHNDVVLKVVGYMNFSKKMQQMINAGRVRVIEVVDYLRLQDLIAKVNVNIAPLVINDFTNCKSELKFFEAAVVKTTTIASPIYSFKEAILDGKNGLLAQPDEWYDKLEYLYCNPDKNKEMARAANKYVLKQYYGIEFLKKVEKAYEYFTK